MMAQTALKHDVQVKKTGAWSWMSHFPLARMLPSLLLSQSTVLVTCWRPPRAALTFETTPSMTRIGMVPDLDSPNPA